MKKLGMTLAALVIFSIFGSGQSSREVTPPGIRQAEKVTNPDAQVPPMFGPAQPHPASAKQLLKEAAELSELARSVSAEVADATNGKMPKDLAEHLKQIEKLSKKLRRDLEPR